MRDRPVPRKSWSNIIVLLIYFGIAVGITWPLAAHLSTHFPGGSQDTFVHYWNGWWVKRSLAAGQSPYYTPYLYYPTGMSLVYHNFAWFSIAIWLVLEPLAGGFAAYNLSILINLALCGLGAFLLVNELTGDRRAAFLAGLIYQCWPFRLSQLDHPNLISTQWIPISLLFLIRTVRQGKWRDAALTGAFMALAGYTRWQQLVPVAILGGIYLICTIPGQIPSYRRWGPALLLAGVVAAVALAPPIFLLMNQQRTASADVLREDEEISMQADLLAYVTPSAFHSVLGSFTQPAYARYYANRSEPRRFAAYIGATTFVLALFGVYKIRRVSLPWVAMAIVLILLALGPVLRVNGQLYPSVPMPYQLASRLYFVRLMRVPDRFNMFLALPVATLSAYGVTDVLSRLRRRSKWAALAAPCLLGVVILFEYLVIPFSLRLPQESQFDRQLSAEPGDFAVLNLPINAIDSKQYMLAQITHQHPILQGKTPRFPDGTFDYLNSQPWTQALREFSTMPPDHDDVSHQLATLAQDGVKYIILHKISSNPLRLNHWRHYFLIPPRFEDEHIIVYPTTPLAGQDFVLTDELAPGIGPILTIIPTGCLNPGQPLGVSVGWGTTASPGRDLDVQLALVTDEEIVYGQTFPLSVDWPTREWPANTVAWGDYTLNVPPSLRGGNYTIALALVDSITEAAQGQPTPVERVLVSEDDCAFPIPPDAVTLNALYGSELRLLGYQLHRDGDQLTLTLHWRSERLMETDYKIYVHVFDPETEFRPVQDDSMPLRWTYPTTYWDQGKVVSDPIPLSLDGVPAGVYHIAVGVYNSVTMERLPVMDRNGEFQPNSQLVLYKETVQVEEHEP